MREACEIEGELHDQGAVEPQFGANCSDDIRSRRWAGADDRGIGRNDLHKQEADCEHAQQDGDRDDEPVQNMPEHPRSGEFHVAVEHRCAAPQHQIRAESKDLLGVSGENVARTG